jgi:hypothetical protein
MVVYDDTATEPVRVFDSGVTPKPPETFGEYRMTYRSGDILSPRVKAAEPLGLELKDFCFSIRAGGEPRSSTAIGIDVIQIAEAVDASLEAGGAPVDVGDEVEAVTSDERGLRPRARKARALSDERGLRAHARKAQALSDVSR